MNWISFYFDFPLSGRVLVESEEQWRILAKEFSLEKDLGEADFIWGSLGGKVDDPEVVSAHPRFSFNYDWAASLDSNVKFGKWAEDHGMTISV